MATSNLGPALAAADFYSFPPFFTLQPVESTRSKQLDLWKELILDHFQNAKDATLQLDSFHLFRNDKIKRSLDMKGRLAVAKYVIESGHGKWLHVDESVLVFVKTSTEWASIIYEFVKGHGLSGTLFTLYELHSGDLTRGSTIQGINPTICLHALEELERVGKAELYINDGNLDESGVKFV